MRFYGNPIKHILLFPLPETLETRREAPVARGPLIFLARPFGSMFW